MVSSWICLNIELGSILDFSTPDCAYFYSPSGNPLQDLSQLDSSSLRLLPLNISHLIVEYSHFPTESNLSTTHRVWCATFDNLAVFADQTPSHRYYSFFPAFVAANYEDVKDGLSTSTTALLYTLGALYCLVLFFLCLYFYLLFQARPPLNKLPIVVYVASLFACICIFRICFTFMLPNGVFDGNPLASYVVAEIPTFLFFSAFVIVLGSWISLSVAKFQEPRKTKKWEFQQQHS